MYIKMFSHLLFHLFINVARRVSGTLQINHGMQVWSYDQCESHFIIAEPAEGSRQGGYLFSF